MLQALSLSLAVLVPLAWGLPAAVQVREFANVRQVGSALVEYRDGFTHAVAAYYHSQRNHDSAWLLIEIGVAAPKPLTLRRTGIALLTPSGATVPLASQRRWGADSPRARLLLQQARITRHQVRQYFGAINGVEQLRFFARPEDGLTVIDGVQSAADQVLVGDLLFESPTGAWETGSYALLLEHDRGTAALPIELK